MIVDLSDLWQFDLQPAPALCEACGHALAVTFGRSEIGRGSAILSMLSAQFQSMQWLHDGHCDLDGPFAEIDARLRWMLESKDASGATSNDLAAYFSRWGVSQETVAETRAKLGAFRGAR